MRNTSGTQCLFNTGLAVCEYNAFKQPFPSLLQSVSLCLNKRMRSRWRVTADGFVQTGLTHYNTYTNGKTTTGLQVSSPDGEEGLQSEKAERDWEAQYRKIQRLNCSGSVLPDKHCQINIFAKDKSSDP